MTITILSLCTKFVNSEIKVLFLTFSESFVVLIMDPVLWTCWVLHQERTEEPSARAGAVRPPARGPDIARLGTARHQPACTEWITLPGPVLGANKSEHIKL